MNHYSIFSEFWCRFQVGKPFKGEPNLGSDSVVANIVEELNYHK
jgi:hypothetical protein